MTKEQAMNLMSQVCASYKGTLQEHQALQQAIELLKKELFPVVEPTPHTDPAPVAPVES